MERLMNDILTQSEQQLFSLIQLALKIKLSERNQSVLYEPLDWPSILTLANKQSVTGLVFSGIESLPRDIMPQMDILMQWIGQSELIKTQNHIVDSAVCQTADHFSRIGHNGILLKGQGIAQLYPVPETRTSGDIDYLILPTAGQSHKELIAEISKKAKENGTKKLHATYHHCNYGYIGGIPVEAHWLANCFYNPIYNQRFILWYRNQIEKGTDKVKICNQEISVPSTNMNLIYLLVHTYRHLLFEGVGLRQVIDYAVLLQSVSNNSLWNQQKIETMSMVQQLGMHKFTAALMWILHEGLGLPEEKLLCAPCEKDGRFLLSEIMSAGNFGKHDQRLQRKAGESTLHFSERKIMRNFRLLHFGPWEVLFTPLWRAWHYFWWMPRHN